jgi:hypothetical protein
MVTKTRSARIGVRVAIGVGVLAVLGVLGKLSWEHRKARVEDAFGMLTAGVARLNASDLPGAQAQFQKSIAEFRAVGRDPVLALHHAFAAKLRSQAADWPEVREIAVPSARGSETPLELAMADDASFLAITTTHRLLCLRVDDGRWAQWELPRPIKTAGALHVDAGTGKAHLVVGDDGELLTADCRAPGSALIATASASANQSVVAWVDADEGIAWVVPANPGGAQVKITGRPLPGARSEPIEMRAAYPGDANSIFGQPAVVHAIAKVGDNILLFYGDANLFNDSDLRDESVLVVAIDEPERQTNRLVFPAFADAEKAGKQHWVSTHVNRVLPASVPGRVYALTEGPPGVAVLGPNGKPIEVHHDSLFSTEYRDGREVYDLSVKSSGEVATMEVARRGTDVRLNYQLPWRFRSEPQLAVISHEGRHVAITNAAGDILLIDLSKDQT